MLGSRLRRTDFWAKRSASAIGYLTLAEAHAIHARRYWQQVAAAAGAYDDQGNPGWMPCPLCGIHGVIAPLGFTSEADMAAPAEFSC